MFVVDWVVVDAVEPVADDSVLIDAKFVIEVMEFVVGTVDIEKPIR